MAEERKIQAHIPVAVTVAQPVNLGNPGLLSVQADVPVSDALNTLTMLLGNVESVLHDSARLTGSGVDDPEAPWPAMHLLIVAQAIAASVHSGVMQHQRQLQDMEGLTP